MDRLSQASARFFRIVISPQAYLNLLYLLVAFPLGIGYFVLLVTGLSAGISLSIVWVGIPILLLVGVVSWGLASVERLMAIHWLKEHVPAMAIARANRAGISTRFMQHISNPVTWKSLIYLLAKFPLGIAAFVVLATLLSLTAAFLAMPVLYELLPDFQTGAFLSVGLSGWQVDSLGRALLAGLVGLILWPVTLHVANGMAWVHAKFARVMLGSHHSAS